MIKFLKIEANIMNEGQASLSKYYLKETYICKFGLYNKTAVTLAYT